MKYQDGSYREINFNTFLVVAIVICVTLGLISEYIPHTPHTEISPESPEPLPLKNTTIYNFTNDDIYDNYYTFTVTNFTYNTTNWEWINTTSMYSVYAYNVSNAIVAKYINESSVMSGGQT